MLVLMVIGESLVLSHWVRRDLSLRLFNVVHCLFVHILAQGYWFLKLECNDFLSLYDLIATIVWLIIA